MSNASTCERAHLIEVNPQKIIYHITLSLQPTNKDTLRPAYLHFTTVEVIYEVDSA
jgi:hypothetical protein